MVWLYGWVSSKPSFRMTKDDPNRSKPGVTKEKAHCGFWLSVHDPYTPDGKRNALFKIWAKGYRAMAEWMNQANLVHMNVWVQGRLKCAKFSLENVKRGVAFYFVEVLRIRVNRMERMTDETAVISQKELKELRRLAYKAKKAGLDLSPTIDLSEFEVDENDGEETSSYDLPLAPS